MKLWFQHVAIFLLASAVVGGFVMLAGVVPIRASSGHWPITKWLLSFSMGRSVATHSMAIEPPPHLSDPSLVAKGAGHFQMGCAPCHGSPLWVAPRIAQRLTPTPPDLRTSVSQWQAEELFYITKHGVKFTGMPAFPSPHRDDEVWAVVAFLLKLPEMKSSSYRQLVSPSQEIPAKALRLVVDSCARCHGFDGRGNGSELVPQLASLHRDYFLSALRAYSRGERHSGIMEPIAAKLDAADRRQVADYYTAFAAREGRARDDVSESPSGSDVGRESAVAHEQRLRRGREIAENGLPERDVAHCTACHAVNRSDQNPKYPFLPGQPAPYLALQLQLLHDESRGGGEYIELMRPQAAGLTETQMRDVAAFYQEASR